MNNKFLNCSWCQGSHGIFQNNCPSCGGSLTHKSDLLNLVLRKLKIRSNNEQNSQKEETQSGIKKLVFSLILGKSYIVGLMLLTVFISSLFFNSEKPIRQNTSENTPKQNQSDPILSAEHFLHQLMREDKIVVGSMNDIKNWSVIAERNGEPSNYRMHQGGNTYVVNEQITFPDNMYGSHSKHFILKEDIKLPYGDIAHNTVYLMSNGKCLGPACIRN